MGKTFFKIVSFSFFSFFSTIIFIFPSVSSADELVYKTLAPIGNFIPAQIQINEQGLTSYLNNMFRFGIALAGGLAVIMIIVGGLQYLSTDAISGKTDGKKRIQEAIQGLILALLSWLILYTINPQLLSTKLKIDNIAQETGTVSGGAAQSPEFLKEKAETQAENGYGSSTYNKNFTPSASDPNAFPGVSSYTGSYTAKDNSGRTGEIAPQIQYLKDYIPTQYSALDPTSTYRSPEHNDAVGGSKTSDHMHGNAIDFHQKDGASQQEFINQGNALVDNMVQNGRQIGVDQIIFRDRNYIWSGSGWKEGSPVHGHYDHVHVGRE